MPTYEYECKKCNRHFDLFQSIKDEPIKRCPKCKGKIRRLIGTGAGIIFKGSGFYMTDYRSKNYVEGAKKDKNDSSGSSGAKSDSGKPDSGKPDSGKPDSGKSEGSAKPAAPAKEGKKTQ